MSTVKVNKITPRTSNSIQLGESGDTLTIPSGATLQNCGTATGFGISFCTTTKTSPFTATAGKGFFINTGSAVTVTLTASPSVGDELIVVDATGCAATNAITLGRNGSKIKGGCNDLLMATDRGGLRIAYSGSSQGWITATAGNDATMQPAFISASGGTETTSGNYKIHTFTSDGTFTVNQTAASAPNNEVSYLVVAGGGGSSIGGGGAGGFRESKSGVDCYSASPIEGSTNVTVTAQAYPITVGGGGAGDSIPGTAAAGSNSVFSTITSAGGGLGATNNATGGNGGSGGGGGGGGGPFAGGTGNTPPTSPAQGFNGGVGGNTPPNNAGGGGGGATAAGGTTTSTASGNGGAGATTSISGSPVGRAGGGGGGARNSPPHTGGTASDGGGAGKPYAPGNGTSGTANTGGGGGGAGSEDFGGTGGSGGSGVVIIRYKFQ
mgnify:CR=1 FL=1